VTKVSTKVVYTRLEQLRWNMRTNVAYKNNNGNNTTPIFLGLAKHNKYGRRKLKVAQEYTKVLCSQQMYFNLNDLNAVTLKYHGIFAHIMNC
jgi:hypothetical protein